MTREAALEGLVIQAQHIAQEYLDRLSVIASHLARDEYAARLIAQKSQAVEQWQVMANDIMGCRDSWSADTRLLKDALDELVAADDQHGSALITLARLWKCVTQLKESVPAEQLVAYRRLFAQVEHLIGKQDGSRVAHNDNSLEPTE